MKFKSIVVLLMAAVLAIGAVGCGSADSDKKAGSGDGKKILRLGWAKDIQTMDVHKTTDSYMIPYSVFDRLLEVKRNDDGTTEIVNSIAKDYSVSDDGLTYSFELRDDVYFSDGTKLTSEDVEATFTRMFTLKDSVQTDFTTCIKGAQAILDGKTDTLEGVHVTDDTHFEITLEEPFTGFLSVLATPTCSIMSKKNLEEAGDDFGMVPEKTIGSGAYMVKEWVPNESMTLVRNPKFWNDPGSADEVQIKIYPKSSTMDMAFQNGDIDILDCDFIDAAVQATYEDKYADHMFSAIRLGTYYITLNADIKPMNDVKVRKAMQMAIDRQSILDTIFDGKGVLVDGIYPSGSIGFTKENQGWLKYDPEGAKKLLKEAGYEKGFKVELASDSDAAENRLNILQIAQQNLKDVGIDAEIKSYDDSSWLAKRKSGEMSCFTSPWILDYNDPSNIIEPFFSSEEAAKGRSLNYKDKKTMKKVVEARSIMDEDERMAAYAALEKKIVEEDAAWIPLFSLEHQYVLSDNIEEFIPHWAGYSDYNVYGVTMK